MAEDDRWKMQERYGYRDEERDRWRQEGQGSGRHGFGRSGRGEGFYSGGAAEARGYGGYGGGGGDVRFGRFSERSRGESGRGDEGWTSRAGRDEDASYGPERPHRLEDYETPGYGQWGMPVRRRHPEPGHGWGEERGFFDRASDEVASWFGNEEAERRRRHDEVRAGSHRGRGPKGYTRSDERIREDVCDRLTEDPFVDASDIEVIVANGEVTLTGTVESRDAKRRAEDCAESVCGVTHVQNNLRVAPTSQGSSQTMVR